tara:strand:- start:1705 stop:1956 length:252 start_codon:yes stop_codon:yes gene_type:complete
MSENTEMLSLFDYLGKSSGQELGGKVTKSAMAHPNYIKLGSREISNPVYSGKVTLYPKWFLDEYFNKSKTPSTSDSDGGDLPF